MQKEKQGILTCKFAEYFTNKDAASIETLLEDNFSSLDPKLGWVYGKVKVVEDLEKLFKDTKNILYEVINIYQDGNTSIVEFRILLDQRELKGVDFIVWNGDKMTELRCYYNP